MYCEFYRLSVTIPFQVVAERLILLIFINFCSTKRSTAPVLVLSQILLGYCNMAPDIDFQIVMPLECIAIAIICLRQVLFGWFCSGSYYVCQFLLS